MAHSSTKHDQTGFTLLEIMVVLAIIAAIVAVGVPRLMDTKGRMKTAVRKLAVLSKEIHNSARLTGNTYRLVFKLEEKKHSFWVESASGNVTLMTEEQEKEEERLTSIQRGEDDEEENPKSGGFSADTKLLKQPEELPSGLYIEDIEFTARSTAVTGGVAYIHYFPQGLVQEAVIHLTDKKTLNWTVAIHPLTGRTEIFERRLSLKELRSQ